MIMDMPCSHQHSVDFKEKRFASNVCTGIYCFELKGINGFKKLSIKKKIKNEKSEKHKKICFLNVCCVMML